MNDFDRASPNGDWASQPWAAPQPVVAREFGDVVLCLRLSEGDSVELNAAAASLFCTSTGPGTAAMRGEDAVWHSLGEHRHWVTAALAAGVETPPAFASPRWNPPARYARPRFPSLPDEQSWRLLVAATARAPRALEAWDEWQSRTSGRSRLANRLKPLIAANLAAQSSAAATMTDAMALARRCWLKNTIALHRLASVLHELAAAGVRAALLKGAASVLVDYRDLALRPMRDVDVVVPLADRRRAIAIMEAGGFPAHDPIDERLAVRTHGGAYIRPGHLNVDLHWHALWANCWPGADESFWATVQPIVLHGVPAWVPSPEMRLLTTCVHGFRHQPMSSHHWVTDAAAILTTHGDRLDWDWLAAEARRRRATCALREACGYLTDSHGAPLGAEVHSRLERGRVAVFEKVVFESCQCPFPEGSPVRATLVSWLNQYRVSARGFRPRELREFLGAMRLMRGHESGWRFLAEVVRGAWRKLRPARGRTAQT